MVKEYIEYLKKNPEKYWFKRKLYGWGWTPATWQGWTVLLVFVALLVLNALRLKIGGETPYETGLAFILETFALVSALILICYKTGESPKWMWGLPKSKESRPKVGIGVIVVRNGKILLGERLAGHGSGNFQLPGGHLEYGETFEETAKREVAEETGLVDIEIKGIISLGNDIMYGKHYVSVGVLANSLVGDPKTMEPEKSKGWTWFDIDDLPENIFLMSKKVIDNWKANIFYSDTRG
jgi:8-oxo-dGTP diphosphatase